MSVAPGGRWNKFKTYSTIQRTFEIWGFVISFLFKAWLNNQKFMYKGKVLKNALVLDCILLGSVSNMREASFSSSVASKFNVEMAPKYPISLNFEAQRPQSKPT